jgi:antirestriction protein ArdC
LRKERRKKMNNQIRKELIENIERELDNGKLPVEEGWLRSSPYNFVTGKPYKGVNRFWLSHLIAKNDWNDNRFCTYKQAASKKLKVNKGGVKIEKFSFYDKKNKKAVTKAVYDTLDEEDRSCFWRFFTVFNGSLIDGLGDPATGGADLDESEMIEICGALADALEDKGFAIQTGDEISLRNRVLTIPNETTFDSAPLFLSEFAKLAALALCEDKDYNYKDVAAQLASAFFAQSLGADYEIDPKQHASRIQGWKTCVSEKNFFKAINEGQRLAEQLEEMLEIA